MKVKFDGTGDGETDKGIHFVDPVNDYTLCGLTLDCDTKTLGGFENTKEKVDCEQCIQIVKFVKEKINHKTDY